LDIPQTSQETGKKLDPLIRDVGTGLGNPIDLAADYYQDQTISDVIRILGDESRFDSIIIEADVHNIHQVSSIMDAADVVEYFWKSMADAGEETSKKKKKPVLVALPDVAYPSAREEAWNIFVSHGLPVFRSFKEAVDALARVCDYYETKRARTIN
jgi:acyl-CoA synthetase (NDP forming)